MSPVSVSEVPSDTKGQLVLDKVSEKRNHRFGFFGYVWVSVFWLGITYLWGGMNGVIVPELNRLMVPEELKGTLLGVITALGMLVAIVVQPAAGALSDVSRHPWGKRRPYILVGSVLVVLGLFMTAIMALYFRQWWLLLVCYLFLQFADNIAQGAYQGMMPDVVPLHRRGTASGAMGVAQVLGNVAGVAGASFFIDKGHPEIAVVFIMIIFSLTLIPTLFLVKEPRPISVVPTPPKSRWQTVLGTVREVWNHKMFRRFIISRLFVLTSIAIITNFALYFLQDVIGVEAGKLTESYTALVLAVIISSLLVIFPAAWLSDKIGRKRLVIIACIMGAVGTVLMSTARTLPEVVAYGAFLGIATGSFNSIDWALATDLIPKDAAGRFMGISNLAGAGSQALAGFMGGTLLDGFNAIGLGFFQIKNMGYNALFIAASACFLLGIVFLLKVHEPEKRH
jgi:MFS family permease